MKGAPTWASGLFGVRLFLIIASGYFMSYGLRAINATIAPELVADLNLANAELGALTSAYLLAFAAMQLPLGVWLDRYGPRRVNAVLIAIAGIGCAVFATATGFAGLWTARALIGIGFAAGLMAPYALYRRWFAPVLQTRLAAWTLMMGTAGVLGATLPVRAALTVIDWRALFWICAAILVSLALAMWFGIPREREPDGRHRPSFIAAFAGYGQVARSPFFWRMALLAIALQGGFIAMQTLWLGPWLVRVLGFSPAQAAAGLFGFNGVLLVVFLLVGAVAPRMAQGERSVIRLGGGIIVASFLLLLLIAGAPALAGLWAWLVFSAVNGVFTPIQARVALSFPAAIAGRALTSYNLVIFVAAFTVQIVVGLLLDLAIRMGFDDVSAFRIGVGAIAALQVVAWIVFTAYPWPASREAVDTPADTGGETGGGQGSDTDSADGAGNGAGNGSAKGG